MLAGSQICSIKMNRSVGRANCDSEGVRLRLRSRIDAFDSGLKDLEARSRNLRDFYSDMSEESGARLARLAKRHTRHLIPPQHTPSKNGKLLLETAAAQHHPVVAAESCPNKR